MSYFSRLPFTDFELNGVTYIVKDILRRSAFVSEYKPMSDLYQTYTILDGETPSSVALKFYSSPFLHWVVLIFNEIHDQLKEWPVGSNVLEDLVRAKYGADTMYKVRHYEQDSLVVGYTKEFSPDIEWVPPENPGPENPNIYPVSFMDYETALNDAKRKIIILRPELLGDFLKQFEDTIND